VPYVPGGGADIVARTMAQKLAERFNVPVIVDNRAGAGGNLGTEIVAKSSPDGYTLLLGNVGPIAINASLYKKLPYDAVTDFAPVSLLVIYPNVLVVHPNLPVKNLAELISFARSRPGKLAYASAGIGSSTHLAAELLKTRANIDITHIPYKGGAQAIVDVLAGQVQMYFSSTIGALPSIRNGKLRALGVTSAKRSRAAPDIPTIAESGFPDYEAVNWLGLLVPARVPHAIIARLNSDVIRIFRLPDVEERLLAQGGEADTSSPAQFAAHIQAEIRKWSQVIKVSGLQPE
jgi:tripartite-type tricarboxylate transporter receptor subunit TctC